MQFMKVDLKRVFENGQSYVALSHAASLDGLQVIGFDPKKVYMSAIFYMYGYFKGILM